MSDRTAPVLEAHACPFLAFDDDRDRRSEEPDHRHRCFAEPRPAPRALAHQRAYCLASSFPSCPIFQDWARREAARAVPGGAGAGEAISSPEEADENDAATDEAEGIPAERAASSGRARSWATPPPWMSGSPALAGRPAGGREEPAEMLPDEPAGAEESPVEAVPARPETPSFLARRDRPPAPPAEPQPRPQAPVDPDRGFFAGAEAGEPWAEGDQDFDDEEPNGGAGPAGRARAGLGAAAGRRPRPSGRSVDASRRRPDDKPAWEPRRRMEAYPTIKTRMGLPNLGGRALGLVALLVAAVALFFLPMLFTGRSPGATTPTPTPSVGVASPSASQSAIAASPSAATVYVVKSGDVLSRVAAKLGVSLDALIAANPQLKDPNKLQIGDRLNIPTTPPSEIPNGSVSPSPS